MPRRFLLDMAALKVTSALCLSLLVMTLLLAPSCGNKEACYEWLGNTYRMLLLCSNKTCNKQCIDEGATSCGNKEACDEWLGDTYRMLLLCSNKTCNKHCIDEGATSVASSSSGPSASAPKNATEHSLNCNGDLPIFSCNDNLLMNTEYKVAVI